MCNPCSVLPGTCAFAVCLAHGIYHRAAKRLFIKGRFWMKFRAPDVGDSRKYGCPPTWQDSLVFSKRNPWDTIQGLTGVTQGRTFKFSSVSTPSPYSRVKKLAYTAQQANQQPRWTPRRDRSSRDLRLSPKIRQKLVETDLTVNPLPVTFHPKLGKFSEIYMLETRAYDRGTVSHVW